MNTWWPRHQEAPDWHTVFLTALEASANVTTAARAAGINRDTAYEHRKTDPEFAAAWETALAIACDALEAECRRRALSESDRLLEFLLRCHRPEVYREQIRHEVQGQVSLSEIVGAAEQRALQRQQERTAE